MLRVESHSHTIYSEDSLTKPEQLIEVCREKGIDRIVITDHNTIAGAKQAQQLAPELIIIGEEIMTTEGEILAAFVEQEIPAGLSSYEVIHILREQNAFISVSHPFDQWRSGHWQLADLINIAPLVDAIEIFNARCMLPRFNRRALEFAEKHDLAGTVGSDAHAAFELGKATMILPEFSNADELRLALQRADYETSLSSPFIHFTSRYAVWRKKLSNTTSRQTPP